MPPKFWAKKGGKKDSAPPSRQRGIQDFFPVSPSSAAASGAAGSSSATQPPAKRQRTGSTGGRSSSTGPKQPTEAALPSASHAHASSESADLEPGSAATAVASGPSNAALHLQRERGPIEPAYVTDPSLPFTAADKGKLTPLEQQVGRQGEGAGQHSAGWPAGGPHSPASANRRAG